MIAAIKTELTKLAASLVGRVTTIAVIVGVVVLSGSFLLAIRAGNEAMIARMGPAATDDWAGYLSSAAQITSAGGLGAFAIVLGWMFGREFAQGTVSGLFALPVSRARIAAGKLTVFMMWSTVCAIALPAIVAIAGLAFGLGAPPASGLLRLAGLIAMNALIAIPIAFVTTLTRSVLGAVAFAVVLVVIAQVSVVAGVGAWNPIALPALWAIQVVEPVPAVRLLLLVPYSAAGAVLTLIAWRRLQLDR